VIATIHVGLQIHAKGAAVMSLGVIASRVTTAATLIASMAVVCFAQIHAPARANSASHVAAELTEGKLNPADSKPGDTVAISLSEDLRSSGEVIFKRGTTITGIIKCVRLAEGKGDWQSGTQSMIEVEWLVPQPQGLGVQSVSFTVDSVAQINMGVDHEQRSPSADFGFVRTAVPSSSNAVNGRSNIALLSMPSVVAVDKQTSASIETTLGTPTSGQLFKVGHGLVSSGGSKESVEFYSHLTNDTVITSPSNSFEISSGMQMQMLVGVNRK
jgi:hypothetical protein